jgi:hypothetical protein
MGEAWPSQDIVRDIRVALEFRPRPIGRVTTSWVTPFEMDNSIPTMLSHVAYKVAFQTRILNETYAGFFVNTHKLPLRTPK